MGGLKAAVAALLLLSSAAIGSDGVDPGRRIYDQGIGRDPLPATMGDQRQDIAPGMAACAACHGPSGLGASEGGIAAPPLAYARMDRAALIDWLGRAMRDGRGRDGRSLLSAMPRYAISQRDLADLADHVGGLPYTREPGLTPYRIAIGLDVDNGGFDQADRAALRQWLETAIDRINGDGGLYGRKLALAAPDEAAFLTISWQGLSDRPNLSVLAPRPGAPDCPQCCGSLHADLDMQVDWLAQRLNGQGQSSAFIGTLSGTVAHPVSARASNVQVLIGRPAEIATLPTGPVYLFADLGPLPAAVRERADTFLVSSFDFQQRTDAVNGLLRTDARFTNPRTASAAVEIGAALRHLSGRLRETGRRLNAQGICRGLREDIGKAHVFSILNVATSTPVGK